MQISYARYLDHVLGGWIGKSIGGAIGTRFEGCKDWIEIEPGALFPETMPPNDDLDLQVLWLKVLEEKGAALTSEDMARAWLEGCWYPFNEYGTFRRNALLGIPAPWSGRLGNQFWETGMGCPIRAEIWGYVFPCAPDLATRYAEMDGTLDHTEQSVGAEKMFAAMASMAFLIPNVRRLAEMFIHHLPAGSTIDRLTRAAFQAFDDGLTLRQARERIMLLAGNPEACDARVNVPFTFLGLLYGRGDMQETLLAALRCGYDTDCTMATSAALLGQILGASRIPEHLKKPVGDELVMGIQYERPEMTISALARDTARIGVLLSCECQTGVEIEDAPELAPLPESARRPATFLKMHYEEAPAAAPGETIHVTLRAEGQLDAVGARLTLEVPEGWTACPNSLTLTPLRREVRVALHAPVEPEQWPMKNLFTARLASAEPAEVTFGAAGAALWQVLGVFYDALPEPGNQAQLFRRFQHHFVSFTREYLPEPVTGVERLYHEFSHKIGRPALIAAHDHRVDVASLIGLEGECCVYLARTILSPQEQEVYFVIGNSGPFRVWLNGEPTGEMDEATCWSPF